MSWSETQGRWREHLLGLGGANRAILALSTARLGDAVGNSILFIVIPLYIVHMPAPWLPFPETIRAGLLISAFGVSTLVQPLLGYLSDRAERRKPFIQVGLLVMAASTFGFVFAASFHDMLALRVCQGIGLAITLPPALALLTHYSQTGTRGGSMGIYAASRMVGFSVGPLLGGVLLDHLGFDSAFYAATAMILLAAALVQLWIHDPPARPRSDEATAKQKARNIDRRILKPEVVGAGLATFGMASAFSMLTPLEHQFNSRLHQGAFAFGLAFSAMVLSRLILQFPLGRLSDKAGRKPVIITGLLLLAPATALMGEVQTTWQLVGLRIVQGLAAAAIVAPAFALAADASQSGNTGRQMSITTMGFGLGIATGPLLAGILAVPAFRLPFIVVGAILVASAWIIHRYVPETVQPSDGSGADEP